ncbi:hypothetical protein CYY_002715 [Polysphondylium violaceum]|uniref:MADS-box domain-containing protein n=1 Tax=Polysphondylium violaceum TaxID=133409 RepID=A0A8J4V9C3_9MYCE|nr:hypothetical protein CYY_002715 [Polysphondylium violaceum]
MNMNQNLESNMLGLNQYDNIQSNDSPPPPSSPSEEGHEKKEKKAGRRKINIEFIGDKSRRHITFSKRKSGIMKKAYELSTLTGTQVLLIVASETGHVYTFATPKLQPLITKQEGKSLIQTCLNTPDAPQPIPTKPEPSSPNSYRDDDHSEKKLSRAQQQAQQQAQQAQQQVQQQIQQQQQQQVQQVQQQQHHQQQSPDQKLYPLMQQQVQQQLQQQPQLSQNNIQIPGMSDQLQQNIQSLVMGMNMPPQQQQQQNSNNNNNNNNNSNNILEQIPYMRGQGANMGPPTSPLSNNFPLPSPQSFSGSNNPYPLAGFGGNNSPYTPFNPRYNQMPNSSHIQMQNSSPSNNSKSHEEI